MELTSKARVADAGLDCALSTTRCEITYLECMQKERVSSSFRGPAADATDALELTQIVTARHLQRAAQLGASLGARLQRSWRSAVRLPLRATGPGKAAGTRIPLRAQARWRLLLGSLVPLARGSECAALGLPSGGSGLR